MQITLNSLSEEITNKPVIDEITQKSKKKVKCVSQVFYYVKTN